METDHTMPAQKLSVFGILKEALKIPLKNTNFIVFAIFTSLPLFGFLVFFETLLQRALLDISEILSRIPYYMILTYYNPFHVDHIGKRMTIDCSYKLIHLSLLYLVPLHLFELGTVIATVDIASKIHIEEKPMTLREMLHKPFRKGSLKGAFVTSVWALCLSTCTLLGLSLVWLVISCFFLLKTYSYFYYALLLLLCGTAFLAVLMKYLERSGVWNMSVVVSVLEERYGVQAMAFAGYISRGSERRGMVLMLVFVAWGVGLRLPCIFLGCEEKGVGIMVQVGVLCVGKLSKWVVCLVYYYECKKRVLEKKADFDVNQDLEKQPFAELSSSW